MKTLEIERFEEHTVLLIQGVDFEEKDLQDDKLFPGLYGLPADTLTALAKSSGFDKWSWTGHLEPYADGKAVKAIFRKNI